MRVLLLADLHIGRGDSTEQCTTILSILKKEKVDLIVILGDFFDRLLKFSSEGARCANRVMHELARTSKDGVPVRILYGTESHEMNQYNAFRHYEKDYDIRFINHVEEEEINGKKIMYLPEEYITDQLDYYKDTLYSDKHYDYIFGHGVIIEGMPMTTIAGRKNGSDHRAPHFKTADLAQKSDLAVFGHYHTYTDLGNNVYYLGSLFRNSFGEEEAKGYGIADEDKLTFIENEKAHVYKTYTFDDTSDVYESPDSLVKALERIKSENEGVFTGASKGQVRMIFELPESTDTAFKEAVHDIINGEKKIKVVLRESIPKVDEIKEEIDTKWGYLMDNEISIPSKISRYIKETKNIDIPPKEVEEYINGEKE